jgi:acyl-CoA thioesterase FadM
MNYGNHLGNDRILALAHEARVDFLQSMGLSELELGEGTSIIMADAAILFKSEGFIGNQIRVEVGVGAFTRAGFDLYYKMVNITTGKDLAYVKTGIVCFDYVERKVRSVPQSFIQTIEKQYGSAS